MPSLSWAWMIQASSTRADAGSFPRTAACVGGFALLSFVIGWLPLRMGLRKVRTFEM